MAQMRPAWLLIGALASVTLCPSSVCLCPFLKDSAASRARAPWAVRPESNENAWLRGQAAIRERSLQAQQYGGLVEARGMSPARFAPRHETPSFQLTDMCCWPGQAGTPSGARDSRSLPRIIHWPLGESGHNIGMLSLIGLTKSPLHGATTLRSLGSRAWEPAARWPAMGY